MKGLAFALSLLVGGAMAALDDIIPDDLKGEEEVDDRLSDDWPRYTTVKLDIIPKGTVENNSEGYWLTGSYSSIE